MIRGIVVCGCGSRSASFGGPGVFAASLSFKTGRSGGGGAITMSEGCCGNIGSSVMGRCGATTAICVSAGFFVTATRGGLARTSLIGGSIASKKFTSWRKQAAAAG